MTWARAGLLLVLWLLTLGLAWTDGWVRAGPRMDELTRFQAQVTRLRVILDENPGLRLEDRLRLERQYREGLAMAAALYRRQADQAARR